MRIVDPLTRAEAYTKVGLRLTTLRRGFLVLLIVVREHGLSINRVSPTSTVGRFSERASTNQLVLSAMIG